MPEEFDFVTHECICGCVEFKVLASFDDFEVATYSLEMYCAACGTKFRTPTPLDRPENLPS